MHNLRVRPVAVLAILSLCLGIPAFFLGCDTGSVALDDEEALEFEYVDVDLSLLAALEQIDEEEAVDGEPAVKFVDDVAPIKRFRSYEDYYITADLISEEARLTGKPIPIQRSLQRYLRFKRSIPLAELALVNHEGRLIVGDTLYSLQGNSYTKRHFDGGDSQTVELVEYDPVQAMADYLTEVMRAKGVSRVTDAWGIHKSSGIAGTQEGCGSPNDFDFVSDPARNNENTDMCVDDFNYPGIRVNPGDLGYTPNAPGAVVMWNTSYTTWSQVAWAEAYTVFYKYRTINGEATLDEVVATDLPQGVAYSTYAKVQTKKRKWFGCSDARRTSVAYGGLSTRANIKRCAGTGTQSWHTAFMSGVSGLPSLLGIE